jgi:hypothetical protein
MTAFFESLNKLLTLLMGFLRKREQATAQHERDKIEDDPADWFVHHFDSVRDKQPGSTSGSNEASPKDRASS